ncbi:MAG: DMT family transporter [Candidatus Latescibacteria bacterium]|nr:DMT family transporter [Candidatus Latescibacterota bacterium]
MQFSPIIVLLGGLIFFKEAFSRLQWIGLGVLVVGMGLFFNQRFAELLFVLENYGIGVWLVFVSAILWGVFMLAQKPLLRHLPSTSIMALVYWFGTMLFLPLAQPSRIFDLPTIPCLLLACSVVFTLVSYLSFAESLKRMEALTPLVTMAVMGLLALFDPNLVPMEPLNKPAIGGTILVVVGSMCSTLGKSAS